MNFPPNIQNNQKYFELAPRGQYKQTGPLGESQSQGFIMLSHF